MREINQPIFSNFTNFISSIKYLNSAIHMIQLFHKYKDIIIYALSLGILLLVMTSLRIKFLILDNQTEVYIGIIATLFTLLGIWLALKLSKPTIKEVIIEREILKSDYEIDTSKIEALGLSARELEILGMMSKGLSNQEIAGALFISLSTVKSHIANIFSKLDVKRRTQAIETARQLRII